MSDGVKIAIIVAVGLILAVCLYIYFSPFQTCVRATLASSNPDTIGADPNYAKMMCAKNSN